MAGGEAEKLTGLSKHFNAVTYTGRANVNFQQSFFVVILLDVNIL